MSFKKKTISDVPLDGLRVLLRADYNVPLKDGVVADDYRIVQSLPTIRALQQRGCQVVICSHLGRPKGRPDSGLSLAPVAERLGLLLGEQITFVPECVGDRVVQTVKHLGSGQIVLLENVRFHPEEETNDTDFAKRLAADSGAAYFVQDGFGVVHRAHASTEAITHFLPSVAGLLLQKEVTTITDAMEHPKRPMVAVLGGAKISDKIKVVERFVELADKLVIGGAMANTFLQYKGLPIGKSVHEVGQEAVLQRIYAKALSKVSGHESVDQFICLPIDVAVTTDLESKEQRRTVVRVNDVTIDEYIVDIGTHTISRFVEDLKGAGTVVWNGTMGVAEKEAFSNGSAYLADQLAKQKDTTTTIVGGGDTADFVLHWDGAKGASFTHISTGGGASLELMAGEKLPGIEALMEV
jgi:phosphoglycerate kinase